MIRSFGDLASIMIEPSDAPSPPSSSSSPGAPKTFADLASIMIESPAAEKADDGNWDGDGDGDEYDDEFEEDVEEEEEEEEEGTRSDADESLDALSDDQSAAEEAAGTAGMGLEVEKSLGSLQLSMDKGDRTEEDLDSYFERKKVLAAVSAVSSPSASGNGEEEEGVNAYFSQQRRAAGPTGGATMNYNRAYDVEVSPDKNGIGGSEFSLYVPSLAPGAAARKATSSSLLPPPPPSSLPSSYRKPALPTFTVAPAAAQAYARKQEQTCSKDSDIRMLAQGARKGVPVPHRVSSAEVPGLSAYLSAQTSAAVSEAEKENGNVASSVSAAWAGMVGRGDASMNVSLMENMLGSNSGALVEALAAVMEQAQGKRVSDKNLRSVLQRRSKPIHPPAAASHNKRSTTGAAGASASGPFGRLDVDAEPATAYGIDQWDPDYHAALLSDEIALSAQLQGGTTHQAAALTGYADLQKRMEALEQQQQQQQQEQQQQQQQAAAGSGESVDYGPGHHIYGKGGVVIPGGGGVDVDDTGGDAQARALEMSLMTAVSLEKETDMPAHLLRTGTDKVALMLKAQEHYATFLSDMVDLCRGRAQASTSIEDITMHRVLAEQVRKAFSGARNIESVQNSMVTAAIETSLKAHSY